jgi:cell wall-associated NlpC family hydrolase
VSTFAVSSSIVPVPARVGEIRARLGVRTATATEATTFDAALDVATRTNTTAATTTNGFPVARALVSTAVTGAATGDDVVPSALRHLGTPYVWGGNDPATGLDCSGFTRLVYGGHGVTLPRVSTDQARMGAPVASLAEARPGDLLAFGSPVDHVAIYLGDGRMVHAAGTGKGVRIDDVYRTPTAIRRLLPSGAPAPTTPTIGTTA